MTSSAVKKFTRYIAMLLLCTCLMQGAWAQIKITGPVFTADPNGYRSDDPEPAPQRFAAGAIIKDCAECPEMVVVPAGGFTMGSSGNSQNPASFSPGPRLTTRMFSPSRIMAVVTSFIAAP